MRCRRAAAAAIALLALATRLPAAPSPGDDALAGLHALEGHAWPRGMTFTVGDGTSAAQASVPALAQSRGSAGGSGGAGAPDVRTSSARPLPTVAAPDPQLAALERQAAGLSRELVEMQSAGMDLAKLARAKQAAALRPILLFLVERGVMTAAEMDAALESLDLDDVLAKIAAHALRLQAERDRVQVLIFVKSIERPGAAR